jgi:ABC-2 type transport system permease protein
MSAAGRAARAMPGLLRVGFAEVVTYRAEMVIWFLTSTMPLVMLLVWDRVAEGGPVSGQDQASLARYFTTTLVVRQLTGAWVVWELNAQIRTGRLSAGLLRPVHPLAAMAAEHLAALPMRILVLGPMVGLIGLWRPDALGLPEPAMLALLLPSLALAWTLHFVVQAAVGCLAFFHEQSLGVWSIVGSLYVVCAGYMFPLSVLPADLAGALRVGPLFSMLGVPVELAAGQLRGGAALGAVALQAAWVGLAALGLAVVWRAGVRRYEAFGA